MYFAHETRWNHFNLKRIYHSSFFCYKIYVLRFQTNFSTSILNFVTKSAIWVFIVYWLLNTVFSTADFSTDETSISPSNDGILVFQFFGLKILREKSIQCVLNTIWKSWIINLSPSLLIFSANRYFFRDWW